MRILICDDDTLIIEQLQKYIESYFESNHLKCPELVFLYQWRIFIG